MQEWRLDDKSKWGEGPWQNEPDKVYWRDESTGLDCLIVRNGSGTLCGYVGVRLNHELFGTAYDDVESPLRVHGGLTFSDNEEEVGGGDYHPADIAYKLWWFGFDCSHSCDFSPVYDYSPDARDGQGRKVYRDLAYVKAQVEGLASQLITPLEALANVGHEDKPDSRDFDETYIDHDGDMPSCPHCGEMKIGMVLAKNKYGQASRFGCRSCDREYSAGAIPPGWEHRVWDMVERKSACFCGGTEELVKSLGYTPKLLALTPDEVDAMSDDAVFLHLNDHEEDEERFVRLADGSGIARGLMVPYREGTTLIFDQSIQLCAECGDPWPTLFMVHDELWIKHASGCSILCCICLEERMGRALTRDDLSDAPINASPEVEALCQLRKMTSSGTSIGQTTPDATPA